jgi:hypothetical protein
MSEIVVAQMNTNEYIWTGAGLNEAEARAAMLAAWQRHRDGVVNQHPALAATLPDAPDMERHFRIHYTHYACGAGYRDGERLV